MYTRSKRSQWSLQLSLWADAVGGSVRNLQRRREMGWRYREGAGQTTAALYAAEQAERRRTMNRRKTQAITAAIVLGVTVPAWAVVNAVSTPSAHNGLAPVSDGTALAAPDAAGDQLTQMLSSAAQSAPALTADGPSDAAWANTMSAAHQFDVPTATVPSPVAPPAAPQPAVAPDDSVAAPDVDAPDAAVAAPPDAVAASQERATVPDTVAAPGQRATKSERHERFYNHRHSAPAAPEGVTPADPAAPAPAAPTDKANPTDKPGRTDKTDPIDKKADPNDPATPGSGWSTTPQSPAKPPAPSAGTPMRTPAKPVSSKPVGAPARPAPTGPLAEDPAAPGGEGEQSGPADSSGRFTDRAPTGETGGEATRGRGRAADGREMHGKIAKSDPSAP